MATVVLQAGNYSNQTATAQITTRAGGLIGFYVNSTSSGTIVFRDGTASGTTITGTITPAIGWHALPVNYGTSGLHITVGGTLNVTIVYQPAVGP